MSVDPFKQIFADRGLAGVGQGAGGGRGDQLGQLDLGVALCAFEAGIADLAVDGNATDRAAWPIIQRHCPDRTEHQAREIIKTWVKSGLLIREKYDDPVERKPRYGLRVDNSKRPQ